MNDNECAAEWTPEKVSSFLFEGCLYEGWDKKLAKAINAAIAKMRKKYHDLHNLWREECNKSAQLREQLAAEERRANDSIEENVRLMNRLAAEQEKIEELHKILGQKRMTIRKLRSQLAT